MNSIEKTIYLRKRRISAEGIKSEALGTISDITLIGCGAWKGLADLSGNVILEPVFDGVIPVRGGRFCILEIKGKKILHDVAKRKDAEFDCEMIDLKINESLNTITTVAKEGIGLYSLSLARMVIPAIFKETTASDTGRWLWVRDSNGAFCFYDTQTREISECPQGTECCFDNADDMKIVKVDNRVKLLTETGGFDENGLRKYVMAKGGRLRLFDATSMKSFVTDIYGHIIN